LKQITLVDWAPDSVVLDRSLAIIAPGQSGQPESPFYDNLTEMWVRGEMFELPYSRDAVERSAAYRLVLKPRAPDS